LRAARREGFGLLPGVLPHGFFDLGFRDVEPGGCPWHLVLIYAGLPQRGNVIQPSNGV